MVEVYVSQFLIFILLLTRITALIVVAPITGHHSVPVQVKVGISLFISLVIFPFVAKQAPQVDVTLLSFFILVIQEVIFGLLIGFLIALIFAGVQYAGNMMAFNMGLYFANMFDPESSQQIPILSSFLYLFTLLIFLAIDGHHFALQAIHISYEAVPIGGLTFSDLLAEKFIAMGGQMFIVAIMLAAPIIVTLFLVNVAFGILSRVVPRMNVFIVSFPMKIGMGIFVLMTTTPMMVYVFKKLLSNFERNILEIVHLM